MNTQPLPSVADEADSIHDVLVIGAGFAGLYGVHRAAKAGLDVLGIEAGEDVGGTWYWNRYPGARCDVESIDYSYSFDADLQDSWVWTERYAAQPEILSYLRHVAERFELAERFRFSQRVVSAHFDEESATWLIGTDRGEQHRARFVMFATGCLSAVNKPDILGVDDFAGEVLHTAQWPADGVSFTGKRVGVIGTGSSGIQAVPIIAEEATSLTVFQRTANYSVPMPNRPLSAEERQQLREEYPARRAKCYYAPSATPYDSYPKAALEIDEDERIAALEARWRAGGVLFGKTFPDQNSVLAANDHARRFAEAKVWALVTDPQTAADLIPVDHPIGSKRICTDIGYFETFNRDNVRLVNLRREPITAITSTGITTTDASYELDTLVYATGFDAMTGALTRIDLRGARGKHSREVWAECPITYLGMTIPGFPNMFNLSGPGSPSVLANMVLHAEQQVEWIVDLIVSCTANGIAEVEPRQDSARNWTDHVTEVADTTLFPQANSWYMGANIPGKKRVFMPYIGGFGNYRRMCDQVQADSYTGFVLTERS